jgi:hypothetical protein
MAQDSIAPLREPGKPEAPSGLQWGRGAPTGEKRAETRRGFFRATGRTPPRANGLRRPSVLKPQEDSRPSRRGLWIALALVPIALAAAFWLPAWWEAREFWQVQSIAGVDAGIVPGDLTGARKKIDPGRTAAEITAAIGKPSMAVGTDGRDMRHEIWTYYFADGKMIVNLTDGVAVRISTVYGAPKLPKSTRPR